MRKVIVVMVALVALLVPVSSWAQKGPIKVGLILPRPAPSPPTARTWPTACSSSSRSRAEFAGREVKLITEDDEGKPDQFFTKTQKPW